MHLITLSHKHYCLLRRITLFGAIVMVVALFGLADSALSRILYFDPPYDKALHIGVYGLIALLLKWSKVLQSGILVWLVVVVIGLGDELHQSFILDRESSYGDFMADIVGAGLGLLILTAVSKLPVTLVRIQD